MFAPQPLGKTANFRASESGGNWMIGIALDS
jgi:hypothetical protein